LFVCFSFFRFLFALTLEEETWWWLLLLLLLLFLSYTVLAAMVSVCACVLCGKFFISHLYLLSICSLVGAVIGCVTGTAVEHMQHLDPDGPIEEARKYLGRFGLTGDLALRPIKNLSGGQKSRLAFAELAFKRPHIMLLDESVDQQNGQDPTTTSLLAAPVAGLSTTVSHVASEPRSGSLLKASGFLPLKQW
jgi:hypothetical protein